MRQDVYLTLEPPVRHLVDDIERAAGLEIILRSKGERPVGQFVDSLESTVSVTVGRDEIAIESPTTVEDIGPTALVHEILHLERTFILGIPHLYPKRLTNGPAAAKFDNWLEHLYVYQRQVDLLPGFQDELDAKLTTFWQGYPWSQSGYGLKFNLLTRSAITRSVCSRETVNVMKDALRSYRDRYALKKASDTIAKSLSDKRKMVSVALDYCGVPRDLFWLRWMLPEVHWKDI